jgi:hypothetical protein
MHTVELDGRTLERGFWMYVWEATTADREALLYVGRTGDSSSINAQSPFNRMGQHLGNAENSSMLRNHLTKRDVAPEACTYRLVAYGPILPEADDRPTHDDRRDTTAAIEKQLAEDLSGAGYTVMNKVNSLKPLHEALYAAVRAAFAEEFDQL